MRIGLWSDMHWHAWPRYSHVTSSGFNSRLLVQADLCMEMASSMASRGVEVRAFLGDWYHISNPPAQVVDRATVAANRFYQEDLEEIFLVGNHDMEKLSTGIHALRYLSSFGNLVLHSYRDTFRNIHAHNYTEDVDELRGFLYGCPKDAVVFLHQGVAGAPVGSGWVLDEILTPDMIPDHIAHCFTGHYHRHNRVSDKLTIIGTPLQHDWADSAPAIVTGKQ